MSFLKLIKEEFILPKMYRKKQYGVSQISECPFCGKQSTVQNNQGIPVCARHKDSILNDMKCVCREYLDLAHGKYGAYFTCINCGNISMKKALSMNNVVDMSKKQVSKTISKQQKWPSNLKTPGEYTFRSDDPAIF